LIPADATPEQLEQYRKDYEAEMNRAAKYVDDYFGVTYPWCKEKNYPEKAEDFPEGIDPEERS
jgi:hypothetical protein